MKIEIKVPAMGESISEATIGTVLKTSGSKVKADEEIVELETDKVNQVLYAPEDGIFNLTVKAGDNVKIGQTIGYIESSEKEVAAEKPVLAPSASVKETPKKEPPAAPASKAEEGQARISREDYLAEIAKPSEQAPEEPISKPKSESKAEPVKSKDQRETRKKLSKVRKVIGERLVEGLRTTAMLTTFNEADMSQVIALREKYKETFNKEHGVRLGYLSFFVKAVVSALVEFPAFNSYIDGEDLVQRDYYDIGIAVGTDRGLFVPVVRDCDRLSYAEIEKAIENYAIRAREGTITVGDLQGGGFTITNGGVYGSLLSTPILNPPQCGILGMHKIEKRPIVLNDEIVIKPMMYLALSYDHRVVDGKEAVSFLVHIKNHLEDPARQLLDV